MLEELDGREPAPLVVWLAGADGGPISNRVALDDPAALSEALHRSGRRRESRPVELEGLDADPLVRIVLWAHDKFIFDLDETPASRRGQDAAAEDAEAEDAGDFCESYAREELGCDPRSQTYRPLTPGAARSEDGEGKDEETPAGPPWSLAARQRIRAFHLLTSWADAVADPRHMALFPDVPVLNYQTLLGLVLAAWLFHRALERRQLRRLLLTLLDAFVGASEGRGFLGRAVRTSATRPSPTSIRSRRRVLSEGSVLIFEPDGRAWALVAGSTFSAPEPVTRARLEEVERHDGSWTDQLGAAA